MNGKKNLLFLTNAGLVAFLKKWGNEDERLKKALFYLLCTREWVFEQKALGEEDTFIKTVVRMCNDDPKKGQELHDQIVSILKDAEEEGRVVFRTFRKNSSWLELNTLLHKNGYDQLSGPELAWPYNLYSVELATEEANAELKVIWRG